MDKINVLEEKVIKAVKAIKKLKEENSRLIDQMEKAVLEAKAKDFENKKLRYNNKEYERLRDIQGELKRRLKKLYEKLVKYQA
ncbi:MAG: hypothetical protein ABH857_02715 [Elusimicrobiota bacterium]